MLVKVVKINCNIKEMFHIESYNWKEKLDKENIYIFIFENKVVSVYGNIKEEDKNILLNKFSNDIIIQFNTYDLKVKKTIEKMINFIEKNANSLYLMENIQKAKDLDRPFLINAQVEYNDGTIENLSALCCDYLNDKYIFCLLTNSFFSDELIPGTFVSSHYENDHFIIDNLI